MRALEPHRQGWHQRDIAAALGASKGAVSRWLTAARDDGPEALVSPSDRVRRETQADPRAGAPDPGLPLACYFANS
jgi:hypothetical protein